MRRDLAFDHRAAGRHPARPKQSFARRGLPKRSLVTGAKSTHARLAHANIKPMPNLYRTSDGQERKPGTSLPLLLADGSMVAGIWAGSATEEKLDWWLRKPGSQLAQSEPVAAIAVKADDNGEIIWGAAPTGARLIFVLEVSPPGKSYRLVKMVTTVASPAQVACFRHERFSLFGTLQPDGTIRRIPPAAPPVPHGPSQGELF